MHLYTEQRHTYPPPTQWLMLMITNTRSLIMCTIKTHTHTRARTLSPLTPTTTTGLLNFLWSDWEVGDSGTVGGGRGTGALESRGGRRRRRRGGRRRGRWWGDEDKRVRQRERNKNSVERDKEGTQRSGNGGRTLKEGRYQYKSYKVLHD